MIKFAKNNEYSKANVFHLCDVELSAKYVTMDTFKRLDAAIIEIQSLCDSTYCKANPVKSKFIYKFYKKEFKDDIITHSSSLYGGRFCVFGNKSYYEKSVDLLFEGIYILKKAYDIFAGMYEHINQEGENK